MADWDDDGWDADAPGAPAPTSKAYSALPSGAVADSWEDEDASDGEDAQAAAAAPKPSAPMKPAKVLAQALKERERAEAEQARAKALARERELESVSAIEKKMRLQKMVEEADLDHARDLFMGSAADAGPMENDAPVTIDNFKPETDTDYKKFAEMIGDKCRGLNSNPKRTQKYVNFVKDVMRQLTKDLNADDVKDLSSHMGILSNEKREAFKKSKGHKKKAASKKTHVKVDNATDMRTDAYDDFDDDMFM